MGLTEQLAAFPLRSVPTPLGRVAWRESPGQVGGEAPPVLVLLHGIGSASASWLQQLRSAGTAALPARVLAWDAPGYGDSDALPMPEPLASDYAQRVWAWLDALGVGRVTLVGHSLGALMAAAATRLQPGRVQHLVLLAPAQGYGRAEASVRDGKLADRLRSLDTLGPAGMARRRGAAMLSQDASPEQVAFIQGVMAQVHPGGYRQAAHMLAGGDIAAELVGLPCPLTVASGSADTITPLEGCEALAKARGVPHVSLGAVGHACALEAAPAVTALLARNPQAHATA